MYSRHTSSRPYTLQSPASSALAAKQQLCHTKGACGRLRLSERFQWKGYSREPVQNGREAFAGDVAIGFDGKMERDQIQFQQLHSIEKVAIES